MDMQLIMIATDGSAAARKALHFAADLARLKRARLLVLHVQRLRGSEAVPPELEELRRVEHVRISERDLLAKVARQLVADAEAEARAEGVGEVEGLVVEGDPTRCIVETARARKPEMLVLGTRGLGDAQSLLLGSVSHKVAHLAPCSCILVR
ncbi:Nucleotide-binding universal stress protein, UspA family [Tistlia consotensis]|uniref:Nucleotide-binding universal stress protein, UspA family n=1 Tax=Tistlia consotensis USBA 355 TaxID=560819 RepID=A0A1Y6CDC6_9PROT|nr:universal stress protein [Tistlia consotensis]SMF48519.1 Nucleotide-binding universal stress protein, UspA family [Tistlia consotensis USBA 355]SNR81110.1 Nucleotide-binding universal stress protein, UspA family [Tistlia consotensis]